MGNLLTRCALIVLAGLCWAGASRTSSPKPLQDQVTIYRDQYGVPHIVGESESATFFGYGYAQAQDHLQEMMLQYRDAQGRRAEVLGPEALGGEDLEFKPDEYRWGGDYVQRLLRTWQCVIENKSQIDPATYRILSAFAEGVNYFIAEHRAKIPAWIDHIGAEDVEALQRSNYMRFYSIHDALVKLGNRSPRSLPNFGSNQWAISPQKSTNGRIIHVENVHMPWGNRFQNYEAHLVTPGKLDVAGISWFGSPFFLCGFNENVTWSATWNEPNIADVYQEVINPFKQSQYLYEGKWREVRVDWVTFRVKDPNGSMRTVTRALCYTHHGPIVRFDRVRLRAYSVRLPNFNSVNYSTGLYAFMKATDVRSFQTRLASQLVPRWNFLCTDVKNIYWVHNAIVPRRNEKYDWLRPVPGWQKDTEWGPNLPFSTNPQLSNPSSGFLQNCNNPPWVATRNSGLRPLDPTPSYLNYRVRRDAGENVLNARGERLFGVLTRPGAKFSLDQMIGLAFDTYVLAADTIVPLLERASAAQKSTASPSVWHAFEALRSWNRRSAENSLAFTYLFYWAKTYRQLYSRDALGRSKDTLGRFGNYTRGQIDMGSRSEQDRAWRSLERAVITIEQKFRKAEVRWGDINAAVRGGTFPMDGTDEFDVLHPDGGHEGANGTIRCDTGWGHLMVVMEGAPKTVWSLLPYGESQDPRSPHYNDQAKLHSQVRLKRFWFTPAEIVQNTESVWGDRNRIVRDFHLERR